MAKKNSIGRFTLARKFNVLSIALVMTTSLVIALYVVHDEKSHTFEELVEHGVMLAEMVSQNSEYGIYTRDQESMRQIIKSLAVNPDIAYVRIMDRENRELYSQKYISGAAIPDASGLHSLAEFPETRHRQVVNGQDGKYYIDILAPVVSAAGFLSEDVITEAEEEIIGYVQLGISEQGLLNRVRQFLFSISIVTSIITLSGIFLTLFMTKRITSPVKELAAIAQEISQGKLDHTIKENSADEISDLAKAFKNMLGNLKRYRTQVEGRTGQLKSTNKRMEQEITERRQTEEKLRVSQERYALAAQGANDGLWDWNMKTDHVYYSPRWQTMLGLNDEEVSHNLDEWLNRVHRDDRKRVESDLQTHLKGVTSHFASEHRMQHGDGAYCWVLCRGLVVRDQSGEPYRMAGSLTDITKRKEAEEQLIHDAFHDALTGLPNRALFMDRLEHAASIAERSLSFMFAVLFLDIDRFKLINDSLGHQAGDQLLNAIGKRLQGSLRPGDTVGRLGGDEFAILLADIKDVSAAEMVARRVQEELRIPLAIKGQELFVSASIGIALGKKGASRSEDIVNYADIAMYHAKTNGKARYVLFDSDMHTRVVDRLKLETGLRKAIAREDFELFYQPILDAKTCTTVGFEALIRWQHPKHGFISPGEFIPVAEDTGLIVPISRWVLREACRQIRSFQDRFPSQPPLTVSVNISSRFFSPRMVQDVKDVLAETGLDGSSLKLEITERMLVKKPEMAASLLEQLKEFGVDAYVDDFGTGYSSLSYLHQFPITALKVDRSFVSRMSSDAGNMEIVKTIIMLAHNLNIKAIAEGIETEHQLQMLQSMNCDQLQGFLFSKPLKRSDLEALLKKNDPFRRGSETGTLLPS